MKISLGKVVALDYLNSKKDRQTINIMNEKLAALQIERICSAYKAAKIPGPTPIHWLGKISRMRRLGKPMPKGLEYLAKFNINENESEYLRAEIQLAKTYFNSKYAGVRAQKLKTTQKTYVNSKLAKESQAKGGSISGAVRRLAREKAAKAIIQAYQSATRTLENVKPVARMVADWHIKNGLSCKSKRAITQMLQRAKLAT